MAWPLSDISLLPVVPDDSSAERDDSLYFELVCSHISV